MANVISSDKNWLNKVPRRLGVSETDLTDFDETPMPIKLDFQIQRGKENICLVNWHKLLNKLQIVEQKMFHLLIN